MQNEQILNWGEVPNQVEVAPRRRASRRARWVFALGLASIAYAYTLFLYVSNPVIQHWIATRWSIVNAPGAFLALIAAGLVFSLPASVMGFRELRAIHRGEIPSAGRIITWVGFLLALVASAFFYIGVLALRFVKSYAMATVGTWGR